MRMKAGKWSAQVHPAGGKTPEDPVHFKDFAAALTFAKAFTGRTSGAILKVQLPIQATYMQRQQIVASGATPVALLS
jgi:hypothetical protein